MRVSPRLKVSVPFLLILLLCSMAAAQNPRDDQEVKAYLPGDIVHVVVGAPGDTISVVAVMPDNNRIDLSFDRRTYTWHGHWEVPYGFKKGTYYAKLIATDVEGKNFSGETKSFYIGEPALITLIGYELTREVELKEKFVERPAPKPAGERPAPAKTIVVEKIVEKVVEKPVIKYKYLPAPKITPSMVQLPGKSPEDLNLLKARLITTARYYMANKDYKKAGRELSALLELEPDSLEIKTLLNRVNELIRTSEARL